MYDLVKNDDLPDVDVCHKDFERYLTASTFILRLSEGESVESEDPLTFAEIIGGIKSNGQYFDADEYHFEASVLDRIIETRDENDVDLTIGTVLEHLHGELTYDGKTYFFVDGEWYQVLPSFIKDLNKECSDILKEVWEDKLITRKFDLKKRERTFNETFIGEPGFLVFDTITPENIEACDVLHFTAPIVHVIHVKRGFNNSVRELASQVLISAKRIEEDIHTGFEYIDKIEAQTKSGKKSQNDYLKKLAGQSFPPGGLKKYFSNKHEDIVFCLAFADKAINQRSLKDQIGKFDSNIAKYSLVELRKQILSMGFRFKVIQLKT